MTTLTHAGSRATRRADGPWTAACTVVLAVSAAGVSPASRLFESRLSSLVGYYAIPASSTSDYGRERFERLKRQWLREARWLSSTIQVSMHPAYQEMIGMGPEVLPWILGELQASPDHWFWALKAISGHDPVTPADAGSIHKMRDAWIAWGKSRGLLPA
jgi:hypothetical protein